MEGPHLPSEGLGNLDANRNAEIIAGSVVLISLSTAVVILRLLSRWMARASLWWDDYIVILALILSWGLNILNLAGIRSGFGRHILDLIQFGPDKFFRYMYAFEILYVFAMSSVKFSIIVFQYRIFPVIKYRRVLVMWGAFTACLTISSLLVCIFQCIPVYGFWTTFAGKLPGAKCVDVVRYIIIAGSINAATDFILLGLPIPVLWRLRTTKLQKLVLTGIFGFGFIVCCVSIVRLILLSKFKQDDITWTYVPPAIWTAAEPSIGVISACLPSLRPLFAKLVWGRSYRPKKFPRSSNSNGHTGGGSWRSGGFHRDGKEDIGSGSFNRLRDASTVGSGDYGMVEEPWRHKAHVRGGRSATNRDADSDEDEIRDESRDEEEPKNGILVRTTVTVTQKIDWLDDLY